MNKRKLKAISALWYECFYSFLNMSNIFWRTVHQRQNRLRGLVFIHNLQQNISLHYKICKKPRKPKAIWMKCRSYDWWDRIVNDHWLDEDWIENFRVTKNTFMYICNKLRASLQPDPNNICRIPLSVEKKVAVALYYLASCCEYRVAGNQFGIHKSTVWKCVHEFVAAVNDILTPHWIRMPNNSEVIETCKVFKERSNLPNIVGCIDGTHIPIKPPLDGYRDFINRKGWASFVLQVVVDHRYRFLDVSIKNPGSTHDAAVLAESSLYKLAHRILPQGTTECDGRNIPYVLVGDPAYPLLPWLLKNYRYTNITPEEDSFNSHMNSARVNVEIGIGRLKARFRCLSKCLDVHHEFVPAVVAACCTLHNILETKNNRFNNRWLDALEEDAKRFPQPGLQINKSYDDLTANSLRDHLKNYLSRNFPLRRSNLFKVKNNLM